MSGYIIGIDPGPRESAYVIIDTTDGFPGRLVDFGKMNDSVIMDNLYSFLQRRPLEDEVRAVVEMPACYGMAVGADVFNTCAVVGHYEWFLTHTVVSYDACAVPCERVYRKRTSENGIPGACVTLCKNNRASDANIRQAIIDLYPAIGGGKCPQIGLKNNPGPLYGVSKDVWAALAVALTYQDFLCTKR